MLGKAHRPAANDSIILHGDFRGCSNLLARQSAALLDFCPLGPTQLLEEGLEVDTISFNERAIEYTSWISVLAGEHFKHDAFHHSHVSVHPDGQPEIGNARRFSKESGDGFPWIREILGVRESH